MPLQYSSLPPRKDKGQFTLSLKHAAYDGKQQGGNSFIALALWRGFKAAASLRTSAYSSQQLQYRAQYDAALYSLFYAQLIIYHICSVPLFAEAQRAL